MADSNTTAKGAVIALLTAVVVAVVSSQTQPWWWCSLVGCKAVAAKSSANPDHAAAASKHPTVLHSHMSSLMMGVNLSQLDYNDGPIVADAPACSKLCLEDDSCKAMTYVFSTPGDRLNGHCWLKGAVPAQSPAPGMISAIKIDPPAP